MKKQIVIAGGGFAGLYAARHLDKTIAGRDLEVVLISDENFTLFTRCCTKLPREIFIQATLSIPSVAFFVMSRL